MLIVFVMDSHNAPKKWRNSFTTASRIVQENTSLFTWMTACDDSTDWPTPQVTCKLATTTIITSPTTPFSWIWIISNNRSSQFITTNSSTKTRFVNQFRCCGKVRFHRKTIYLHFRRLHRMCQLEVQKCCVQSAVNQCRRPLRQIANRTKMTRKSVGVLGEYRTLSTTNKQDKTISICNC